jgi:hypothetical protein
MNRRQIDRISRFLNGQSLPLHPGYLNRLLRAAATGTELGVALVNRDARFESANAKLAYECHLVVDELLGRTTREGVGELAAEIEPVFERVFASGKPQSLWLQGRVRNAPEAGCWYGRYLPVFDTSGRVCQVAVFTVNVTAARTAEEIIAKLFPAPRWSPARLNGLLIDFEATVIDYQMDMLRIIDKVARQLTDPARSGEELHSALRNLDMVVSDIRDLSNSILSELPIPHC